MVMIALHKINSENVSLIERDNHYKIKYKDQFTFLKLFVYSKIDSWSQENGFVKLTITDPTTIQNIREFDTSIINALDGNYSPILQNDQGATYLYLSPQVETLRYYQTKPTTIYLNLKMIRKAKYNPKANRTIIHIF